MLGCILLDDLLAGPAGKLRTTRNDHAILMCLRGARPQEGAAYESWRYRGKPRPQARPPHRRE
jgi:hypothetical protein